MKKTILGVFYFALFLFAGQTSQTFAQIQNDIAGPMSSMRFGTNVIALPNGNFVVTDPSFDLVTPPPTPSSISNVGAVYLYNGTNGSLISTLVGRNENDRIGSGQIIVLPNSNFLVGSPLWDSDAESDVGAVTFCSGTTGCAGEVTNANSLVGSTDGDEVGDSLFSLGNGNYIVNSAFWDRGAISDAGAVTFCNGATGCVGEISSATSLVGASDFDVVGEEIAPLANFNYVVGSSSWDRGAINDAGAVTFCNGSTGCVGEVSAINSLVGSTDDDLVGTLFGFFEVVELNNGNYIIGSTNWDRGSIVNAGAATLCSGSTGCVGEISVANSLVGSTNNDSVGASTFIGSNKYVVTSSLWDNGAMANVGAVTLCNGTTGCTGAINPANALTGSAANNQVGSDSAIDLPNGDFVAFSSRWDNGAMANVGAATLCNGTTGCAGMVVSAANSLIGSTVNDFVGEFGGTSLTNGNYTVGSPSWNNGGIVDAGAVTFCSGTGGCAGTVVSPTNSLVGSTANDNISQASELSNGKYVVNSAFWDNAGITDAGAVTLCNGITGCNGTISSSNSLVGLTANDLVGNEILTLTNGNYVVASSFWNNGGVADVGAVTFCTGASGCTGAVSAANSLIGSTADDQIGSGDSFNGITGLTELANGDFVIFSPEYDNGGLMDAGAVTYGSGNSGVLSFADSENNLVGTLNSNNSVFGTTANTNSLIPISFSYDAANSRLIVGRPLDNIVTMFRPFGTTAANVSVSGRVFANNRGLPRAFVVMTDSNGIQRIAQTNSFGYYRFENVEAGGTYVFDVKAKQYSFDSQVVNVNENLTDLNFAAQVKSYRQSLK